MPRFFSKYSYYLKSIFEVLGGFKKPLQVFSILLGKASPQVRMVELRGSGVKFKFRGAMDVWSIKETFLDRFYDVCGFPVRPGWTVFDIGAGLGEYTLYAAQAKGSKVYGFEPFPQSFDLLRQNLKLNRFKNIHVYEEAIGGQSGSLTLDLSSGEPLQFQSVKDQAEATEKRITVRSTSLAEVFARLGLSRLDLLKLDCEGAEYDILFNTPPELLKNIHHIVMEYHDHTTAHTHVDMARFLENHGFQVDTYPNPVHSYFGYLRAALKTK